MSISLKEQVGITIALLIALVIWRLLAGQARRLRSGWERVQRGEPLLQGGSASTTPTAGASQGSMQRRMSLMEDALDEAEREGRAPGSFHDIEEYIERGEDFRKDFGE